MVKYSCERCGKGFSQKSHYDSHKRRKTPCENNADKIKELVDKAVEEKLKELNNKKLILENEENTDNTDNKMTEQIIKLPNTRYQGSKKKIINKIYDLIITTFKPTHILDLFGGSAICSLYFQINNIATTYNDILKFNSTNANGLLDNDLNNIPSEEDIKRIFKTNNTTTYKTFIYDTFKDIYYTDIENRQLDIFRENIKYYSNENITKKNIMYYFIFQSLISKRPYNLFHRKNLSMRTADVKRSFGNKVTWEKTFIVHMLKFRKELIKLYEQKKNIAIGNTNIINMSYNKIPDKIISDIDTIYIDPPYFKKDCKNSQYFDNYHFLEGFISELWDANIDFSTKHLKLKTSKDNIIENANKMFDNIIDKYGTKNLVISYNTKAFPTVLDIETKLKKKYSKVITKYIDYNYALSKTKSQEVLILALVI
jgi:adenine-specific DNA-methyltransferase